MYNVLIGAGAALLTFLAFYAPGIIDWWGAALLGLIAFAAAYFVLARRSLRQLEAVMMEAQKDIVGARQGNSINKARIDAGLDKIREGFKLGKWQFFITGQVHAQLGMILFMLERFDEARPHLEKSFVRIGQARAMLAVLYFKDKEYVRMAKVFEEAVGADKKNGLVWSTYAWCLENAGQKVAALEVLGRAVKENPADEKVKDNQRALQNNERLRMKPYGQEWWAFRLEPPPMDFAPPGMRIQPGFRKGYRQPPRQR